MPTSISLDTMTSWLTVKERVECIKSGDEDLNAEPTQELGIFKLRSIYARGINALHCSGTFRDKDWLESRRCFEEIIRLTHQTNVETAAARSECDLLLFLAYSNLSRILANSNEKEVALCYSLSAASFVSISDRNIQDPGLQLRMAKLALDTGDLWSCKHIIQYSISKELGMENYGGGLADSFLQLYDDLNDEITRQSSIPLKEKLNDTCRIIPLQILEYSTSSESSNMSRVVQSLQVFKELTSALELLGCSQWSFNYSFRLNFSSISFPIPLTSLSSLNPSEFLDLSFIPSTDSRIQPLIVSLLCDPDDLILQHSSDIIPVIAPSSTPNHSGTTFETIGDVTSCSSHDNRMVLNGDMDSLSHIDNNEHTDICNVNQGIGSFSGCGPNYINSIPVPAAVNLLLEVEQIPSHTNQLISECEDIANLSDIRPIIVTKQAISEPIISITSIGNTKNNEIRKSRSNTNELKNRNDIGMTVGRRRKEDQNIQSSLVSKFSSLQVRTFFSIYIFSSLRLDIIISY